MEEYDLGELLGAVTEEVQGEAGVVVGLWHVHPVGPVDVEPAVSGDMTDEVKRVVCCFKLTWHQI